MKDYDSHKIKKYFLYKPKDRYLMKISCTSLKRDLNFNKDIKQQNFHYLWITMQLVMDILLNLFT